MFEKLQDARVKLTKGPKYETVNEIAAKIVIAELRGCAYHTLRIVDSFLKSHFGK